MRSIGCVSKDAPPICDSCGEGHDHVAEFKLDPGRFESKYNTTAWICSACLTEGMNQIALAKAKMGEKK